MITIKNHYFCFQNIHFVKAETHTYLSLTIILLRHIISHIAMGLTGRSCIPPYRIKTNTPLAIGKFYQPNLEPTMGRQA
jgi:hypothetical protein